YALGVAPERIHVMPDCAYLPDTPLPEDEVFKQLQDLGLRPGEYGLFVGAIHPRKNLSRLCQAWNRLDTDMPLVVVGPRTRFSNEELRFAGPLRARRKLRLLGYVPATLLRALYSGANLFAFPSLYEGFGLPPLEAMANDCPVLVSDTSSLPE